MTSCNACGEPLLPENVRVADGCPCNSPRGINHGLVAVDTCTCPVCDPEQTGSTRWPELASSLPTPKAPPAEVPPVDRNALCTVGEAIAPGVPNTEDRGDGQQKGYVILCAEERAKGFVRPVRRSYVHVGRRPKYPLRELTAEERAMYKDDSTHYETYPPEMHPSLGRLWSQRDLTSGCGTKTTMGQELAETFARSPDFYSGTFCCGCSKHIPVAKDGEFVWAGTDERVGT